MSNIRWERDTRQWANGYHGFLGKAMVFGTYWDASSSKDCYKKIKLTCTLAGYKSDLGNYAGEDEARVRAERVLLKWLEFAGLRLGQEDIIDE